MARRIVAAVAAWQLWACSGADFQAGKYFAEVDAGSYAPDGKPGSETGAPSVEAASSGGTSASGGASGTSGGASPVEAGAGGGMASGGSVGSGGRAEGSGGEASGGAPPVDAGVGDSIDLPVDADAGALECSPEERPPASCCTTCVGELMGVAPCCTGDGWSCNLLTCLELAK